MTVNLVLLLFCFEGDLSINSVVNHSAGVQQAKTVAVIKNSAGYNQKRAQKPYAKTGGASTLKPRAEAL